VGPMPLSVLLCGSGLAGRGSTDTIASPFAGWLGAGGGDTNPDREAISGWPPGKSVVPLRARSMQKISMHTAERVKNFIDIQGASQGAARGSFLQETLYRTPPSGTVRCKDSETAKPMPRKQGGHRNAGIEVNYLKKLDNSS